MNAYDKLIIVARGNVAKAELDLDTFLSKPQSIPEHIDFANHALILAERLANAKDVLAVLMEASAMRTQ